MPTSVKYNVSIVNYYNTTPFVYGLNHFEGDLTINLEHDIPSVCAHKLQNNLVDIGLVPVAILPFLNNYSIISDYCIGAIKKVDSVKLYSQKPLNQLTHIVLDYQSRTSVKLIQVLNQNFWKLPITFINGSNDFIDQINDTTGGVIIGDRTFGLNTYAYEYDLAEEWYNFTKLPFVFACWVAVKPIEKTFLTDFNNALQYGVNHIKQAVEQKPNLTPGFDAFDYLSNKISYTFDEEKQKALQLFLDYLKELKS